MGSEWKKTKLKEVGIALLDCVHKTPKALNEGYPYITIPQLQDGHINFAADTRLISEDDLIEWTKKVCPTENDVVLSRRCNPGETAFVPRGSRFALGQNLVLLRSTRKDIFPPFLRWLVRGRDWWNEVDKFLNVGAVFDSLRCADIPNFELPIPPLSEQRAIAHILGSLDDKIELNRRMNGTLEGMAQALFKSWFVDFDPVIDNAIVAGNPIPEELADRAEVRRAALADGTANREAAKPFPAAFQQTEELGWIPEGWKVSSVGRHISLQRGTTYKSRLKGLPGPYLLGLGSIQRNGGFKENTLKTYGGDCPPKMVLKPGDIFVSLKDITQAADLLGSVARLPHHISSGRLTQDTVKLVFDSEPVSKDYIYNMLLTERYRDHCRSRATGTTNLGLAREDFFGFPFAMPSSEVQIAYDRFVQSCNQKHQMNTAEGISLTKLRDTLLPKLISGELRIPDAEKLAEAALA